MKKDVGYFLSTLSVLLLAVPSFKAALEKPALFLFLVLGVATSIAGMALRWITHRTQENAGGVATRADLADGDASVVRRRPTSVAASAST
jgi:hypothetical protein